MSTIDSATQETNQSLKDDIMSTIDALLTRPKMWASSVESLEGQFYNLIVLVAPYQFNMDGQAAGRIIMEWISIHTGTNTGLSGTYDDVEVAAKLLRDLYTENFECFSRTETVH